MSNGVVPVGLDCDGRDSRHPGRRRSARRPAGDPRHAEPVGGRFWRWCPGPV